MKQIVAWSVLFCLSSEGTPVSEASILGTYTIAPFGISDTELRPPLPQLITISPGHIADFVFDGDGPSAVSLCETNWTLNVHVLLADMNCLPVFPELKPMIFEIDLHNVTEDILSQERGFSVTANLNWPGMKNFNGMWSGTIALTRVPQGPLDVSNLVLRSGDGVGLKNAREDPSIGCCLDDECDSYLPCSEVELNYSNGRVFLRLIFDRSVRELNSIDLLQSHLRRAYLSIAFEMTSRVWEFAELKPRSVDTVFTGLDNGRIEFNVSGIIDKSIRLEWKGGVDGHQTYEEVNPHTPFNISFDLEALYSRSL